MSETPPPEKFGPPRTANANQPSINARTLFGWVGGMVLWTVCCSLAWYASARGDYANMRIATACYSGNPTVRAADSKCTGIRPPDVYMNEVNRKAAISRLASAGGAGVACVALIVTRRRSKA